jgi:hypothetical protein
MSNLWTIVQYTGVHGQAMLSWFFGGSTRCVWADPEAPRSSGYTDRPGGWPCRSVRGLQSQRWGRPGRNHAAAGQAVRTSLDRTGRTWTFTERYPPLAHARKCEANGHIRPRAASLQAIVLQCVAPISSWPTRPLPQRKSLHFTAISDRMKALVLSELPGQRPGTCLPRMTPARHRGVAPGTMRSTGTCANRLGVRNHLWLSGARLIRTIVCSPHDGHAFSVTDDSATGLVGVRRHTATKGNRVVRRR